ncbi:MAG: carbon starvation protein A, partial [Desulfohalobiaceae bacterium]|nr:carbon starvation protein A [Desulfohalobiaceae bacterium]
MTTVIIVIGFLLYMFFYFTYGKKLERDVVKASDSNEAPSKRIFDGVDYIPARREVLFGHHFASIAGAAPIIGPALAICWGWVPGLLWVWFGNIFIGAVHDYLAL